MNMPLDHALRFAKQYKLQWEPAQNAWVLLYPEALVTLTETASEILRRIDGNASALDIINSLESAYPGADLAQDVIDFLEHTYNKGWITDV